MARDFVITTRALRELERSAEMHQLADKVAKEVRDRARRNARVISPRLSDAIIAAPSEEDSDGVYADVGYDKNAPGFVLWWHEVGTKNYPATPHLRPALKASGS